MPTKMSINPWLAWQWCYHNENINRVAGGVRLISSLFRGGLYSEIWSWILEYRTVTIALRMCIVIEWNVFYICPYWNVWVGVDIAGMPSAFWCVPCLVVRAWPGVIASSEFSSITVLMQIYSVSSGNFEYIVVAGLVLMLLTGGGRLKIFKSILILSYSWDFL